MTTTYRWYWWIIRVHGFVLLWEQKACDVHLLAVSDGDEAVAPHLGGCLFLIFAYDTWRWLTSEVSECWLCTIRNDQTTWRFAGRLWRTQRHVDRFPGGQTVQGGCIRGAGLPLPPRHGDVCDRHVELQDAVDVVLEPKLRHCSAALHSTCCVTPVRWKQWALAWSRRVNTTTRLNEVCVC